MARAGRPPVPVGGQVRQRRRAAAAEGDRRRAEPGPGGAGAAPGAASRVRRAAAVHHALCRAARRGLRARDTARHPPHRAHRVSPSARAVAALPSRAPDRRRVARHRARLAWRVDAHELHAVLDHPGAPRVRPGRCRAAHEIRLALRGGDVRRGGDLHRLHHRDHRVAHGHPAARQRARLEGQHARHRQPAQLRDGEVLQQRGIRGAPLRRQSAEIRVGRGHERDVARAPERRPELHHRHRGDAAHDLRRPGGGRADADPGRSRAHQRSADPALHTTQLPRHGLSGDQAGAHRHGPHVRAAHGEPRDRGHRRRVGAAGGPRRGSLRERELQLRPEANDSARRELRDSRRQQGRGGGALGVGQVHALAPPLSLLRRERRPHHGARPRPPRREAGEPARRDRHRSAGYGALQRHDLLQHPLRPAGRVARRSHRGGARSPHPRLHREPARPLRGARGRARTEAFGRRKAARGDRAGAAQEPAHHDLRRGHVGARFAFGAGDPVGAAIASPRAAPRS